MSEKGKPDSLPLFDDGTSLEAGSSRYLSTIADESSRGDMQPCRDRGRQSMKTTLSTYLAWYSRAVYILRQTWALSAREIQSDFLRHLALWLSSYASLPSLLA